ncbi:hypothetical protein MMC34_005397 [Xylographa carneopallida]|nr:hypothetical protein [Xylographa carneopallida]
MPSSPLPLPTTDSLPSSTSTTTSPPDSPPTTAEAAKEAKKIVRLLLNPQRLLFPIPSRVCKLLPRSRLYLRHHPMPALKRLDFCDIRANEPTQASLHDKISALSAQMAATQAKIDAIKPQLISPTPETTVKQHIALLHTYNEIRDVGQGLLGMVAENRGVRIRDVYAEFGVAEGD